MSGQWLRNTSHGKQRIEEASTLWQSCQTKWELPFLGETFNQWQEWLDKYPIFLICMRDVCAICPTVPWRSPPGLITEFLHFLSDCLTTLPVLSKITFHVNTCVQILATVSAAGRRKPRLPTISTEANIENCDSFHSCREFRVSLPLCKDQDQLHGLWLLQ